MVHCLAKIASLCFWKIFCKILFCFFFLILRCPARLQFFSEKNFARLFSVSSFLYYVLFRRRILQGYLSSLLVYCHSQYGTIFFKQHFAKLFLFLLSFILWCPAKHKRAPQTSFSHTARQRVQHRHFQLIMINTDVHQSINNYETINVYLCI